MKFPFLKDIFGKNVNHLRDDRGLSQKGLLVLPGLGRRHLENLEAGREEQPLCDPPTQAEMQAIANKQGELILALRR